MTNSFMNHINMEGQIERNQLLTTRLYDAALKGDVYSLLSLLRVDPLVLDRCIIEKSSCFMQSPLHVAANFGHLAFTEKILDQKPELAEEVDQLKGWSPLHVASSKGHLQIVQTLLVVKPNLCCARDQEGRNPVHVAAINGKILVLEVLIHANPQAAWERTDRGETILHLCIKHRQPEALKFLSTALDNHQLLNFRDRDGNTILHLAVAAKQHEMVDFILRNTCIDINAVSVYGLTARDTLIQSMNDTSTENIKHSLKAAKALPAKDALKQQNRNHSWLENQRSALMVVASLIATMAFQVGINPPGGCWQDDTEAHIAGTSILTSKAPGRYNALLISNTLGLVSSLSVIILLISGLPCKRLFMGILMFTLWIAATATTFTYLTAVLLIFDIEFYRTKVFDVNPAHWMTLYASLIAWDSLMALLLLGHSMRFIVKQIKQPEKSWINLCNSWFRRATSPPLV